MNREDVFKMVQAHDFDGIVKFLKDNRKQVAEDEILQNAINYFLLDVIADIDNKSLAQANYTFSQLYLLHRQQPYFTAEQYVSILTQLCKFSNSNEEKKFYAEQLPDNEYKKSLLDQIKAETPKEIIHEQTEKIQVQEMPVGEIVGTKSIFNSKQERIFFNALRNSFPHFFIYPNASLSMFIYSSAVEILDQNEKKFFYNSSVDFLLVDQLNDFHPYMAIELDSEWHRQNNQVKKDNMKDKIIKASGLKFYRIEHFSKHKTVEEFEKMIRETISARQ